MSGGAPETTRVVLGDGGTILIGPLGADDRQRYLSGIGRAGPESLYRRFMTPVTALTEAQLRYLLEIDHRDHEALLVIDESCGDAVAVGRFVRLVGRESVAEVAIIVIDAWQGRGVGKALSHALAQRAVALGIERFEATVLQTNKPMLALLNSIGTPQIIGRDGPGVTMEVPLPPSAGPNAPA